jgi:hypothetical protein
VKGQAMTDVIASKLVTVRFSIPDGTRPENETAISEKLRSNDLIWEDDPGGAKVVCVAKTDAWRPRKRFSLNNQQGD